MFNSQYYTCEQIDQRLLQGYLDDYNTQTGQSLTKEQFLTKLGSTFSKEGVIDNTATQIGYYECDTAAGTAAKAITVANYVLFAGGSMKVKFANKNTANNATLNINSQGAKALYYQGERASATNSWDANEVVEIYYDGTSYYANNVNGGSGSGVYDVSKEHPTSGPNSDGKFTLEYILNSGNVSELIPVNKRYPGMSIQFVSSSDNKYVQYRLTADGWSINVTDWVCEDEIIVKGQTNKSELSITDENFYAILKLLSYILVDKDGNVRTKNFNSAEQAIIKSGLTELANKYANTFPEDTPNTFSVEDENDNAILYLLNYLKVDAGGNITTKAFDSSLQKVIADEDDTFRIEDTGEHAILLLQNYLKVDKDGNISTEAFSSAKRKETLIIVDANGNGDYTTIEDALNNANDSATHHVNILIKEGVYYPAPKVSNVMPYQENNRNISLIGEDRNKCIIRNDIGFYDYSIGTDCTPLRLNGNVTIENLTILSYSTLYRQYYGTPGFVTERADRNSSYCIHRDGNSNEGDEFVIKNCILINDHFTCVGFGLKKNVTLRIEDCYCQSEENEDDSAESQYGVLYGHLDSGKKGLNQNLEVIRCQLVNLSSYQAINLMDAKASDATPQDTFANLKFIGNIVDTTNNTNAFVTQNTIEGFYAISKLSFGNKCEAMNYND